LLCEVIRYGIYNKEEMLSPLALIYRQIAESMSEERRLSIFQHTTGFVQNTSFVSTNAYLPFIVEDRSRMIASTAVIDYVSLGHLKDNDPMSRVKDVVDLIERGVPANEGAVFGALLHIGDKRVCELLVPLRDSLDDNAVNEAVKCSTGFISSATTEF